jgi:hypothetical protein
MTEHRPSTESELVEFVRSIDVRAPDSLHREVESLIGASGRGARRRAGIRGVRAGGLVPRIAAAGALAAAVAAVAIAVGLSGGSSALSQRTAMALTLRAPTLRAPAESRTHHAELAAAVDGVSFPYWARGLGWRPVGARTDHVAGRTVATVFYADRRGHRVGYAIVAGSPAPQSSGGMVRWRGGTPFRVVSDNGVPAVVWLRSGHMCVVSGRGVTSAMLLRLASWRPPNTVAS